MVPSVKNTALIFPEIFFIQCFTISVVVIFRKDLNLVFKNCPGYEYRDYSMENARVRFLFTS